MNNGYIARMRLNKKEIETIGGPEKAAAYVKEKLARMLTDAIYEKMAFADVPDYVNLEVEYTAGVWIDEDACERAQWLWGGRR